MAKNYGEMGVGNSAGGTSRQVTMGARPGARNGGSSEGETAGVGSRYAATFVQRPNSSNPRNMGPSREMSEAGASPLAVATTAGRKSVKL